MRYLPQTPKTMFCPKCWNENTKVLESRLVDNGSSMRRRRECENCSTRFTTFERIEVNSLNVIKSSGGLEKYDREKLEDSIILACNKRWISVGKIEEFINFLENSWGWKKEISSKEIWLQVLEGLKKIDNVAYVRYASVHLNFKDVYDFMKFIQEKFI